MRHKQEQERKKDKSRNPRFFQFFLIYDDVYMLSGLTPLERRSHDPGVFSSRGRGGRGGGRGREGPLSRARREQGGRGGGEGQGGGGRVEAPGCCGVSDAVDALPAPPSAKSWAEMLGE